MRHQYSIGFIFFLFLSFPAFSQGTSISELETQLNDATQTERVDILNQLSSLYTNKDYDQGAQYAEEAYDLSERLDYSAGFVKSAYYLGIYNRDKRKYSRATRYTERGIEKARSLKDRKAELKGYAILKTIHMVARNPKRLEEAEKAYEQLSVQIKAESMSEELQDLQIEYETKEEALRESETEIREIRDELDLTIEEKLLKDKELALLEKQKAEVELLAERLENRTIRDSLAISQKEKELLQAQNELRQKQFVITLSVIGLIAAGVIVFILLLYYRLKRKTAEEKIKTQRQLLMQEKLATLGQLTAGIAHEIKNPLNFVTNFARVSADLSEELEETLEDNKSRLETEEYDLIQEVVHDLKENSKAIAQNGQRADRIVQSMMDHARGESGKRQAMDVNHLLRENFNLSYQGFKGMAQGYYVELEEDLQPKLPVLKVIPQDFSRVLLNIFNNAHYALDEKRKELGDSFVPKIKVSTRSKGKEVIIKIRDNGPGIPEEIKKQIFNPFFTTKPTGQGNTGLGLSISHDIIVQVHEGKLEVYTEPGEFTEFVIILPTS
jgi:signal transduction histidine kinase